MRGRFPDPYPFPDPSLADEEDGLVALGVPVTIANLRAAYPRGIFPWPFDARAPIPWVCPPRRAVLEFDRLSVPKTLRQARRRSTFTYSIDRAFERVIGECTIAKRPGQDGTWIIPAMHTAYIALHREGGAHSVEVWDGDALVGGLYGVNSGGVFTGESMFHRADNASKLALLHLVDHLAARDARWIDIQQLTPHMAVLGARELSRDEFLLKLRGEQVRELKLFGSASV